MPEYMLDTDTVSFALRGRGRVAARLLEHRPSQLCISSITLAELRFGADTRRSQRLHRLITTFIESVEVVRFDERAHPSTDLAHVRRFAAHRHAAGPIPQVVRHVPRADDQHALVGKRRERAPQSEVMRCAERGLQR